MDVKRYYQRSYVSYLAVWYAMDVKRYYQTSYVFFQAVWMDVKS